MLRAADLLARRLHEAGCRYAFGMPGGEVLTLVDALENAGIRFILCKHENAAGFMAEGTYHRTGKPGLLVATVGPGIANGVNVIANALQDRVPLIVLSGCVDADEALTYTHQVFDHRGVLAPVTKATFTLTAAGADVIADKAVLLATSGRPGPVHIDVPIGVADCKVASPTISRHVAASPVAPAPGPDLEAARRWLGEARRPLLIAGLDVLSQGAEAEVAAFAERFAVPVITTYKAKGVLPEDHALALGAAGLSPLADEILQPIVRQADLLLLAGYDPIEMRVGWRNVWDPAGQHVVELSAAANHHYMHHATVSFVCDVRAGLQTISEGVSPQQTWPGHEPRSARTALHDVFGSHGQWGPAAIVETVRQVFPRNTVATVDSGAHRILLSQLWQVYEPRGLLQSSALCTMGCALPLAMGVAVVEPRPPIVAFTGDAGLLMVLGELSTLAEHDAPVVIVVFVDASLTLIEMKQNARQLAERGVTFGRHDFAAIGAALGGVGVTVSDVSELERACHDALDRRKGFTLIAATLERGAYEGRI